jgi:toxin ParE1/3/4
VADALRVVYHPIAEQDLGQSFDFIAADSPERAIGLIRQIRAACLGLIDFPERGRLRGELGENVRKLVFRRRVVIAYRIEVQQILVLRIFYAGQQIDSDRFQD